MIGKHTLISSKTILGKVARDFNPSSDSWTGHAMQWIGEAFGMMHRVGNQVLTKKSVGFVDYKAVMPCNVESLQYLCYNDMYFPLNKPTKLSASDCGLNSCLSIGYINGTNIIMPDETGTVVMHYMTIQTDNEGFPLVTKNDEVLQAAAWYVIRGLLLRGESHPVLNFQIADQMWEKYLPRAINSANFPSPIEQESFTNLMTSIVPNNSAHYSGYYTGGMPDDSNYLGNNTGGSFLNLINRDSNE